MDNVSGDIKDYWLFWRIVIFGVNESFDSVDKMTLNEILQYNEVIDLKEELTKISTEVDK
jgi:hypothetical protein